MDKIRKKDLSMPQRIAIVGRRQIGKTVLSYQIAKKCFQEEIPSFLIEANPDINILWNSLINNAYSIFDGSIIFKLKQQTPSANNIIGFLSWLLRCGVVVVIDEFQRLSKINGVLELLQSELDKTSYVHSGTLIVLGSHITKLQNILMNQSSPLWLRHFQEIVLLPIKPLTMYSYLSENFKISSTQFFNLYCFLDGIIGLYRSAYIKLESLSNELLFDGYRFLESEKLITSCENPYRDTLGSSHSYVLGQLLILIREGKSANDILSNLGEKLKDKVSASEIINDLIKYNFIAKEKQYFPISGKEKTLRYAIVDHPLLAQLYKIIHQESVVKFHFEAKVLETISSEIMAINCRKFFSDTSDMIFAYQNHYWSDQWTEMDVVLFDEGKKNIYWGSCKRNFDDQEILSYIAHIYSFIMERHKDYEKFKEYKHILFFISPEIHKEHLEKNLIAHFPFAWKKVKDNDIEFLKNNAKSKLTKEKGKKDGKEEWKVPKINGIEIESLSFSLEPYFYVFSMDDICQGKGQRFDIH